MKLIELDLRRGQKRKYKTPKQVLQDHLRFHLSESNTQEIREYQAAIEILDIAFG